MLDTLGQPDRLHANIQAACIEVMVGYCRCVDTYDDDAMIELFTRDGEWRRPGADPLQGREAIRAFLATRNRSTTIRHVVSNMLVNVQDATHASGLCYWTVFRRLHGTPAAQAMLPFALGEYHDQYKLEDNRWRIASRETRFIFRAD